MPGVTRYVPYTPSPNTAVSNDKGPSGFTLVAAQTREDVPRQDESLLTGVLTAVGIPAVMYSLTYFSMDGITSAVDTEYCDNDPALQLQYFGEYVDNCFLVGGSVDIGPAAGDRGVKAVQITQHIISLGQRTHYV